MNFEQINNGEYSSGAGDSLWGESYTKDLPPFNPDRQDDKESDKHEISERDVAVRMLDFSDEQQEEYVDWLNQINQKRGLSGRAADEYDKFLDENHLADGSEALARWQEDLDALLENLQKQDELIVEGLEDLERPENAGKTLDEIFAARANKAQEDIESLASTGAWSDRLTDEQRELHVQKRDGFQSLAKWAPYVRDGLKREMASVAAKSAKEDIDTAEAKEDLDNAIDIDGELDDLQAEIQKREKSLEALRLRDQRDYGDDVLRMSVTLREKQADLHVMKMIKQANHEQSEDEKVSLGHAAETVAKYIADREKIISALTEQRAHYVKGSEEYKDLTKKRSKWYREVEAAYRVSERFKLPLQKIEDGV